MSPEQWRRLGESCRAAAGILRDAGFADLRALQGDGVTSLLDWSRTGIDSVWVYADIRDPEFSFDPVDRALEVKAVKESIPSIADTYRKALEGLRGDFTELDPCYVEVFRDGPRPIPIATIRTPALFDPVAERDGEDVLDSMGATFAVRTVFSDGMWRDGVDFRPHPVTDLADAIRVERRNQLRMAVEHLRRDGAHLSDFLDVDATGWFDTAIGALERHIENDNNSNKENA